MEFYSAWPFLSGVFLFLPVVFSRFIPFFFFNGWVIFCSISCIPRGVYSFICLWTLPVFWLLWVMLLWAWPTSTLSSFLGPSGCILKSGIAGLGCNSLFNPLRNCQAIVHYIYTTLYPHQQCIEGHSFSASLLILVTLPKKTNVAIVVVKKCYLIVVWICISLND